MITEPKKIDHYPTMQWDIYLYNGKLHCFHVKNDYYKNEENRINSIKSNNDKGLIEQSIEENKIIYRYKF